MKPLQFLCPTCGAAVERDAVDFPFCSERCRLIDLGRWSDESYRIPGDPAPIPDENSRQH